jgi:hypothetical protein
MSNFILRNGSIKRKSTTHEAIPLSKNELDDKVRSCG